MDAAIRASMGHRLGTARISSAVTRYMMALLSTAETAWE